MEESCSQGTMHKDGKKTGVISKAPYHHRKKFHYLLHCKICQDTGSGLHYGVITCTACKSFFGRNMTNTNFQCSNSGKCRINAYNRTCCAHCRLQKCYDAGMSPRAIKKGRYSARRKTQYILESTGQMMTYTPELTTNHCPKEDPKVNDLNSFSEDHTFLQMLLNAKITSTHVLNESAEDDTLAEMHNTGHLDHRSYIQREIVSNITMHVNKLISFLKNIPEFLQMTIPDQVAVVKESHFEYHMIESYERYNTHTNWINVRPNKCFHKDEMSLVWGKEFIADMFILAKTLQHMGLTRPEIVLTEMMCVLSPDRCQLEERNKIESFKRQVVNTLLGYLHITSACPVARFAKIIDIMTTMRTLTERYMDIIQRLTC